MTCSRPAVTFLWRPTTDTARVHAIHRAAIDKAPPGMVRADSLAHFERHCGELGEILGCFLDTGEMIAYGVLGMRSATVDHLADMLGARSERFCVLDGAASLPQWRGFSLHNDAISRRVERAASLGLPHVGATVAPSNIRSMRGLLRSGLAVRGFARMYGGMARLLVSRDASAPPKAFLTAASVPVTDQEAHQDALARGLVGYACRQDDDGSWFIEYAA